MRKNMDWRPRFTVIIPNKNRAEYLHHTLRTCMMQNYEPFEVLVSDDNSTDNARDVVVAAARQDSRIRLITPGPPGGMRDNFEFALRNVKPGFVIALGGDDGLLPDGIQGMRDVLCETGMELLAWPAPIYLYPGVRGVKNGQLSIYRRRGVKIVRSADYLARQVLHLHYLSDFESPMFYVKGVVSTQLIDQVRSRSKSGRFYECPTPDGYSGIVLAGEVEHFAFSGKPFSIYGLSNDSQGLAYMANDDRAKKMSERFYQNVAEKPMHTELASQPYSPLITLMTVDYLLTAQDLPGWLGRFPPINWMKVLDNSLRELAHGLYGEERVRRELEILRKIAGHHHFESYFHAKVRRTRRYYRRAHYNGTGINAAAFLLDGLDYGLKNIYDAAYAAQSLHRAYVDSCVSSFVKIVCSSVKYRCLALRRGGHLSIVGNG